MYLLALGLKLINLKRKANFLLNSHLQKGASDLNVISADSAAAILDPKFNLFFLVASVSVLVEPPYREPSFRLAEPIFREVESGFDVIVHETELCRSMLDKMKADVVHLDISLGGSQLKSYLQLNCQVYEHLWREDKIF